MCPDCNPCGVLSVRCVLLDLDWSKDLDGVSVHCLFSLLVMEVCMFNDIYFIKEGDRFM